MANTTAFIKALRLRVNEIIPTYYEEAPSKAASFPYAVLNGINIIDLAAGDLASFYLDIWVDEKMPNATEELEAFCDKLRNELTGAILSVKGIFASHIGFDNQNAIADSEYDIAHRRLAMSARIFYN
jgi:hypothetical protein|nr:MAG TPA: hypothetical protein [Caudoviricetes sp.]